MRAIERLATTPDGQDPEVDALLDHAVVVFNVIQNPDGRVRGTRANANGFDLNRDYITQSQPETVASVQFFRNWLPTEALDLHGYVEPTLLEGTTVPHNPGIEYDLWLKWSQPRLDANEAGLASEGYGITRPINNVPPEWIPAGETLPQGWDDWGPFYTGQYGQLRGLDTSTVEMCWSLKARDCGIDGARAPLIGDNGALRTQELSVWSTFDFVVDNRREMMLDQLEIYRRGVEDAPRPELSDPLPVIGTAADHDYMTDYPRAHVIPVGAGQRSDAEAKRLVDFLLGNDIEVERLTLDYSFGGQTFQAGSYVVYLDQALRALGNTMLHVGDDISDRVTQLYAPPGAWSNGFLWGADVVTIGRGEGFEPSTTPVTRTDEVDGGVRSGARRLVRARGRLADRGPHDQPARRRRCGRPARHRAVRDGSRRDAGGQRGVLGGRRAGAQHRRRAGGRVVRARQRVGCPPASRSSVCHGSRASARRSSAGRSRSVSASSPTGRGATAASARPRATRS